MATGKLCNSPVKNPKFLCIANIVTKTTVPTPASNPGNQLLSLARTSGNHCHRGHRCGRWRLRYLRFPSCGYWFGEMRLLLLSFANPTGTDNDGTLM